MIFLSKVIQGLPKKEIYAQQAARHGTLFKPVKGGLAIGNRPATPLEPASTCRIVKNRKMGVQCQYPVNEGNFPEEALDLLIAYFFLDSDSQAVGQGAQDRQHHQRQDGGHGQAENNGHGHGPPPLG